MIHVEALDGGVGLAGADGLDLRRIVGHAVHAHFFALDVRVEEADVQSAIGLDLVAVFVEQRHINGDRILEHLALALHSLGHGVHNVLTLDPRRLHGRTFGQHAFGGGYLHQHVAGLGIALERRVAHVGFDLDDVFVGNGGFRLIGLGLFRFRLLGFALFVRLARLDLGIAGDRRGFNFGLIGDNRSGDNGHDQGAVDILGRDARHAVLGGDGHVGVRGVLRGDGSQLEAGVGACCKPQLFVQFGGQHRAGEQLILHGHERVLSFERYHGFVDRRRNKRLGRRRLGRIGILGRSALAMLHGLVDRFLVGLADHLIGGSGLGFRTVLLTFVACERQDVRHRHDQHHRHEDGKELAFERVFKI